VSCGVITAKEAADVLNLTEPKFSDSSVATSHRVQSEYNHRGPDAGLWAPVGKFLFQRACVLLPLLVVSVTAKCVVPGETPLVCPSFGPGAVKSIIMLT
jgi:hypothetical protein